MDDNNEPSKPEAKRSYRASARKYKAAVKKAKRKKITPAKRKKLLAKAQRLGGKARANYYRQKSLEVHKANFEEKEQKGKRAMEAYKDHIRSKLIDGVTTKEDMDVKLELEHVLTPTEILFCEYYVSGCTKNEAFRLAYLKNVDAIKGIDEEETAKLRLEAEEFNKTTGSKITSKVAALFNNKWVKEYIKALREEQGLITKIDIGEIVTKVRKVYNQAYIEKKWGDCLKATQQLGDIIGAFQKTPINLDNSTKSINVFTSESLQSSQGNMNNTPLLTRPMIELDQEGNPINTPIVNTEEEEKLKAALNRFQGIILNSL